MNPSRILVACVALLVILPFAAGQDKGRLPIDPAAEPAVAFDDKLRDYPLPEKIFRVEVAFAARLGPFVALGGKQGAGQAQFVVVSLKDGKNVGKASLKELEKLALSPDGTLIAGVPGPFKQDNVIVIDAKTGKQTASLNVEKKAEHVQFIDNERLYTTHSWDKNITVWNIKTGNRQKRVQLDNDNRDGAAAVSPGGNWLVTAKGGKLEAYDLKGGDEITVGDLPKMQDRPMKPDGFAFSPDGKRLAGLFEYFGKRYVTVWNLETGAMRSPVETPALKGVFYKGTKIESTPDGLGWLVNGEFVADGEGGGMLWKLPEDARAEIAARATAVNQVLAAAGKTIKVSSIPKEKIAEMKALAKSGGDVRDAVMGKTTPADLSTAKTVPVPLGNVKWTWQPGLAPDASTLAARPFKTEIPANQFGDMAFSDPAAGIAVIEERKANAGPQDQGANALEAYNLVTGKQLGKIKLATPARLLDVSPDGKSLLLMDAEKQERIDVLSIPDGKPVAAFRPDEKSGPEPDRKVKFAGFADDGHVVTVNAKGMVVSWAVPACKAEAVAEVANMQHAKLSPDRKALIGQDVDTVRVFDALTLQPKGDGALPTVALPGKKEPRGVAVKADGSEMAALYQITGTPGNPPLWYAARWDAKTGASLGGVDFNNPHFYFPGTEVAFNFAGKFLLFNNQLLIDPATRGVVWNYNQTPMHGRAASRGPDDRLWYGRGSVFNQPANVVAVNVPESTAEKYIADILKATDAVLRPEEKIQVVPKAAGDRANVVTAKMVEAGTAAVKRAGHPVGAGGAVLTLELAEKDLGEKTEYRLIGRPGTVSVSLFELTCTPTLELSGQTLWKGEPRKIGMRQFFVSIPANENDIGEYLRKQMWEGAVGWAGQLAVPRQVVKYGSDLLALPGTSTLEADGLKTQRPTAVK